MYKFLTWKKVAIVLVVCLFLLTPANAHAQSNLPQIQVVELSGIEPPPPGIAAQMDWGWGGGGFFCTGLETHRISGDGFMPPLGSGSFGIFIDCVEDTSVPVAIYFYYNATTIHQFIAVRYVYASSARNALIEVNLSRSFPYDSSLIDIIVGENGAHPNLGYATGWRDVTGTEFQSPCRASLPPYFSVGDSIRVSSLQGLNLVTTPDLLSTTLVFLPFGATASVVGNPTCSFDGRTFWAVQYGNFTGWLAQGDLGNNWITRYFGGESSSQQSVQCPGALPSMVQVGQRARIAIVDGTPANMRIVPDGNYPAFRTIPELIPFTVISGPNCGINNRGESVAYWLIQLDDGTKGWVIEVTPTLRIIEPI